MSSCWLQRLCCFPVAAELVSEEREKALPKDSTVVPTGSLAGTWPLQLATVPQGHRTQESSIHPELSRTHGPATPKHPVHTRPKQGTHELLPQPCPCLPERVPSHDCHGIRVCNLATRDVACSQLAGDPECWSQAEESAGAREWMRAAGSSTASAPPPRPGDPGTLTAPSPQRASLGGLLSVLCPPWSPQSEGGNMGPLPPSDRGSLPTTRSGSWASGLTGHLSEQNPSR